MRIRTLLSILLTLTPALAFAGNSGKGLYTAIVLLIIVGPYWILALIPFAIQWRNKGRSIFWSMLVYILCIGGITLAKYHWYGAAMPDLYFDEEERLFLWMVLPFVIVIFLTARKNYNYWK